MGWLRPFANLRRSSWVREFEGSRKITVAGFPPNGSRVNAFAIANGYDLGMDVEVDDMEGNPFKIAYVRCELEGLCDLVA